MVEGTTSDSSPAVAEGIGAPGAGRIGFVDALRGLAIVLMVLVHVARAVVDPDEAGAAGMFRSFLMTTEPLISTLFLTLVGVSLVLARGKAPSSGSWWRRRLGRALPLVFLSWGIFWVHGGVNPPYPFLSAEILYTIGLAVLLYAPVVGPAGVRWWLLAIFVALGAGGTALAEVHPNHFLARLAQGPGAHLPNLLFPALGIFLAWTWRETGRGWLWWRRAMLPVGLVIVVAYHLFWAPANQATVPPGKDGPTNIQAVFDRPFGRVANSRKLVTDGEWGSIYDLRWVASRAGLADPPPRVIRSRAFWNKKLVLVPYLAGWMFMAFGLASLVASRRRTRLLLASPLWPHALHLIGRHPLKLYVFHLALAAMLSMFPGRGLSMPGYAACVAGVLLACAGTAWGWERHQARHPVARMHTR